MSKESVEVVVEGFSGPLDLLCHLVESRQMQVSKIKMTQIVRIYGVYLSKTRKASVETLAEFFFMVARLLLQKTLSLLPAQSAGDVGPSEDSLESGLDDDLEGMEGEMHERLARYRPYRAATAWLEESKARQDRHFRREAPLVAEEQKEPLYEIGDLYFLSRIWWGLLEKRSASRPRSALTQDFGGEEEEWEGIPSAPPEEYQIQARIAELEEKLALHSELSLNAMWALSPSIQALVVTLLAVLEMCRMGKTVIEQEALFSDVKIRPRAKE
jgi:segregation and condensation protein A